MSDILEAAKLIADAINNLAAASGGAAAAQPAKTPKGSKETAPAAQADTVVKAPEPEVDPAKYEVVKGLILRINKEISRDAVLENLKPFGATKGPELQVKDYDAFIEAANAALDAAAMT